MQRESKATYWAERWASLAGKQKVMLYNPGNMLKRRAILNYIRHDSLYINKRIPRILDVGGGLGDLPLEFYQENLQGEFLILDVDGNVLQEAKTTLQYFGCGFLQGDAQKLPFEPKTFDIVVCSEVLEHLPRDGDALHEIRRVAKDTGLIIITIPYLERHPAKEHLRRYSLEAFNRLCDEARLEIKDIRFCGRSIQVIRNMLRRSFKRENMGQKEGLLYSAMPVVSNSLVSVLKPIDNILAHRPLFPNFLNFLNEATLIAYLRKQEK